MWQDWFLGVKPNGRSKYKSLRWFVKQKAKSDEQRDFLIWYLGPKEDGWEKEPEAKKYTYVAGGPVDWVKKRNQGGWFNDVTLKEYGNTITRQINALEALREVGNKVTLPSLLRAERLAESLDREMKGVLFLPDLTMKENEDRANTYLRLHEKILNLKAQAQDLYAKSHGVNFDDMNGLVQLMQATAMAAEHRSLMDGSNLSKEQLALKGMVEMVLQKSAVYGIALPEGSDKSMAAAIAEGEAAKAKRRGVQ